MYHQSQCAIRRIEADNRYSDNDAYTSSFSLDETRELMHEMMTIKNARINIEKCTVVDNCHSAPSSLLRLYLRAIRDDLVRR